MLFNEDLHLITRSVARATWRLQIRLDWTFAIALAGRASSTRFRRPSTNFVTKSFFSLSFPTISPASSIVVTFSDPLTVMLNKERTTRRRAVRSAIYAFSTSSTSTIPSLDCWRTTFAASVESICSSLASFVARSFWAGERSCGVPLTLTEVPRAAGVAVRRGYASAQLWSCCIRARSVGLSAGAVYAGCCTARRTDVHVLTLAQQALKERGKRGQRGGPYDKDELRPSWEPPCAIFATEKADIGGS